MSSSVARARPPVHTTRVVAGLVWAYGEELAGRVGRRRAWAAVVVMRETAPRAEERRHDRVHTGPHEHLVGLGDDMTAAGEAERIGHRGAGGTERARHGARWGRGTRATPRGRARSGPAGSGPGARHRRSSRRGRAGPSRADRAASTRDRPGRRRPRAGATGRLAARRRAGVGPRRPIRARAPPTRGPRARALRARRPRAPGPRRGARPRPRRSSSRAACS